MISKEEILSTKTSEQYKAFLDKALPEGEFFTMTELAAMFPDVKNEYGFEDLNGSVSTIIDEYAYDFCKIGGDDVDVIHTGSMTEGSEGTLIFGWNMYEQMAEAGCDKYEYMKYLREKYMDMDKLIINDKNLTFLVGKNDDERNLFPVPVLYDIDNDIYYSFKEIIIESGLGMEERADVVEGESKDVDVYFDYGIDTDIDKINEFYDYGGEFTDAVYLYDLAYYSKEAERNDEEER